MGKGDRERAKREQHLTDDNVRLNQVCKNCRESKYNSNVSNASNLTILKIFILIMGCVSLFNKPIFWGEGFGLTLLAFNAPILIDSFDRKFKKKLLNVINNIVRYSTSLALILSCLVILDFLSIKEGKLIISTNNALDDIFSITISNYIFLAMYTVVFILEIVLTMSWANVKCKCPHYKEKEVN